MPHFVVDCSQDILASHDEDSINTAIHKTANASGLFLENEIKVRINPYHHYSVGGRQEAFIHVFSDIMEGRTAEEKAGLSRALVKLLTGMFPQVSNIAVNVRDFEKATYFNRTML